MAAPLWSFRHYVSVRGVDEIRTWFDAQSANVRGTFASRLRFFSQNPQPNWPTKYFKMLSTKPCKGLGEVRMFVDKVQHRPLTFFDKSKRMTLTFVICAIEKDGEFLPRNACKVGNQRKTEIEANAARSKPSDIPLV
jgi:hypothetical protein